jgi:enoyl-CoA hydratase/carnithine racemase
MARDAVRLERHEDGVTILTLNQPERRNAMTSALLADFASAVRELRADRAARVLVVTGAGRHFCSGADFREAPCPRASRPTDGLRRSATRHRHKA